MKVAIIGGTGVYNQSLLDHAREIVVETSFGRAHLQQGFYRGRELFFLARHGTGHALPPHLVNYRANIFALKELGIDAVISTAAVGTLRRNIIPGSRVLIDQFIDFTKTRVSTFFEGEGGKVVHVDFTEPYCFEIRTAVLRAGAKVGEKLVNGGCYVCTEGPRFETPAEIRMMAGWGGDLVGMTNVPEVTLAREAGLCYATVCLATNFAAGISATPLTHEEVLEEMGRGKSSLDRLLAACVEEIPEYRSCRCRDNAANWPWGKGRGI